MQIQSQSQVLTFYVSEAFFDLHMALINCHVFLLGSTRIATSYWQATTVRTHVWRTAG